MKEFFKFMFASMLGMFLMSIILFFFFIAFIFASVAIFETEKPGEAKPNSVLKIKLDYDVPERTVTNPFSESSFFKMDFSSPLGLNDILKNIRKAKNDDNIKGIYLDLDNFIGGGLATVESIRKGILDFKESGKFVIAYGANISQGAYYLGSVADKVFISPVGMFDFRGLSAEVMFLKGTLDKLEIEPQIFQYGKFKSAVEPLKLEKMSEENKKQTSELLFSVYDNFLLNIEKQRGISIEKLKQISDEFLARSAKDAKELGLIDSLIYPDEVAGFINQKVKSDFEEIELKDYKHVKGEYKSGRDKIAVIYAVGEIGTAEGDEETIGTENIIEAIKDAREDEKVKAIVMRVNSPGGDAITSDLIWREVQLTKKEKPFIISMGDVAASGGYYIACAADTIVAEANTITGSIGVFGVIPNFKGFFNEKLGITFDGVKTGKYSDFITVTRPLNNEEKKAVQGFIDDIYETFVNKVGEGRNKTFDQIHEIAQGRIWSGVQAKENGLIDLIGDLNFAINIAAEKANIKDYAITEYPKHKPFVEKFLDDISAEASTQLLKFKLGENYKFYEKVKNIDTHWGIKTRMFFDVEIK